VNHTIVETIPGFADKPIGIISYNSGYFQCYVDLVCNCAIIAIGLQYTNICHIMLGEQCTTHTVIVIVDFFTRIYNPPCDTQTVFPCTQQNEGHILNTQALG